MAEGEAVVTRDCGGVRQNIGVISKGDVAGEIAFIGKGARTATVTASRSSKLLEFTPEAFDSLPERVQLRVFRRLAELAQDRLENQIDVNYRMSRVRNKLSSYIKKSGKTGDKILSSELISDVIRNIPKLPMYTRELAVKLLDERVSPKEVAESIKLDPSLAAMILKTVNSSYFGLPQAVSDFSRAVVLLGFTQVYQLVLYHGIHSLMPEGAAFRRLQAQSYMLSLIAYEVSLLSSRERAGTNSTIGLLSDVGKSVILLLKKKNPRIAELIDMLDHTRLGGALLRSWKLPEQVCAVIELQNLPEYLPVEETPKEAREALASLHISKLCHAFLIEGDSEPESAYFEEYMAALGLRGKRLDAFCKGMILPALLKNEVRLPAEIRKKLRDMQYGA